MHSASRTAFSFQKLPFSSLFTLPKLSKMLVCHYTVAFFVRHFVFSLLQIYLKHRTNNPIQEEDIIWISLAVTSSKKRPGRDNERPGKGEGLQESHCVHTVRWAVQRKDELHRKVIFEARIIES